LCDGPYGVGEGGVMVANTPRPSRPAWLDIVQTAVLAFLLAFLIRTFVVESCGVAGSSMYPTLKNGDRVLVNKLAYVFGKPETGQIIVFRSPVIPSEDWIKRVIGVPGDVVAIRHGQVFIDGKRLPEPYVKNNDNYNYAPVHIPPGYLFVLGDNRPYSYDSRYFGLLNENRVVGEAFLIWWPLKVFRWL
jgi:signal peptidase I